MNKIGSIFAMYEELEEMLKLVKLNKINKIYDLDFYECTINDKECILVESGVGKVNASRSTQVLIDNYSPNYILNVGVAGGIDNKLNVCDIVVSDKLVQYDFDITAFNHPKGYIPKVGVYVECDRYLRELAFNIKKDNVYDGTIATGDMFCTDIELSKKIKEEFIEKFQDAYSALKDRNSREHYIDLLKEIKDDKAENDNKYECKGGEQEWEK